MALVDQKTLKRELDILDTNEANFYNELFALKSRLEKLKVCGDAEIKNIINAMHTEYSKLHHICYRKTVDACESDALVRVANAGLIGKIVLNKAKRRVEY